MKANLEKLKEVYGDVVELTGPTGYKYTIRQQTGEDDDILSNAENVMDGTSSNKFIQGLIVDSDYPSVKNGRFSVEGIRNMKLCDKYFIMIASRIFSIGQILKFTYTWPTIVRPVEYEEDLGLYIWDYGDKPFPGKDDPDYFRYRIKPHPLGKEDTRQLVLQSGKRMRYTFVNGHSEKFLMGLPPEAQSINAELMARNLELALEKDKWVKVQNFKTFTPRDMMEIRKDVGINDPEIELVSELQNPETKEILPYNIVGTPDFFYPREI